MSFVKLFLKHGTSPFIKSYKGRNCVHAACYQGRLDMLKLFFESNYMLVGVKTKLMTIE